MWQKVPWVSIAERDRLRKVLQLNAFCFATADEQLCFSAEYAPLVGAGLFIMGSGFNHPCSPNLMRYNIGDCLIFRTNSAVKAGTELCFSYLAPEVLHCSVKVRARHLDFTCSCHRCYTERSTTLRRPRELNSSNAKTMVVAALKATQSGNFTEALQIWHRSAIDVAL